MGSKPSSARQPDTATPERLAVDALFRTDAVLRGAVTENLTSRLSTVADVAARVENGWRLEPSLLSAEERGRRHYVAPGTDPSEVLEGVVLQGVDGLRSRQTGHTLTLRASAELEALIQRPPSTDAEGGVIELGSLLDLIASKRVGTAVISQPPANRLAAETEADSILGAIEQGVTQRRARHSASSADAADESESGELVERAVNVQMGSATSPEAQLSYGTIPNSADDDEVQRGILQTFELRPGASDVTSYHDFHTLQIAFDHVWTEIFDGQLAKLGRELYREYVKLKVFVGSDQADLEVSTLDDLRRLMEEVKHLGQFVDEESPSAVREIVETGGRSNGTKNDGWKALVGVATGGASYLFDWALQELSKIGRKPIIRWADFPGPWPPRQDRIHVSFANSAPKGSVEIELRTDPDSHIKIIEFEPWDEPSKRFLHGPAISNAGHNTRVTMALTMSQVAAGVLEFASEESTGLNLGRYVLSDLPEKLVDGTRVTFYWRDL